MSEPIDAVVLAGGPADALARRQPGAPNKAFVEIGGVALVGRVLAALRGVLVGRAHRRRRAAGGTRSPRRSQQPTNCAPTARALPKACETASPVCRRTTTCSSSLPTFRFSPRRQSTTSSQRVRALAADVVYGCVEKRVHLARFPDVPHTWARLRDGTFCGGGLVSIKPRALPLLERFIERLGAARKHPSNSPRCSAGTCSRVTRPGV